MKQKLFLCIIVGIFMFKLNCFAISKTPDKQQKTETAADYIKAADIYSQKGNYLKAIEYDTKAIKLNPNCSDAYCNIGQALTELQYYKKALNNFNRAIQLNTKDSAAYLGRGNIYAFHIKNYKKALNDFDKAMNIMPNGSLYYSIGYVRLQENDNKEAVECFKQAIAHGNEDFSVYTGLGTAMCNMKKYSAALDYFNTACNSGALYSEPYSKRAALWLQLGKTDNAISDARKAARLGDNTVLQELKKKGYNVDKTKLSTEDYKFFTVVGSLVLFVLSFYYGIYIIFLYLFYINYKIIPEEHRKLKPVKVWLSLIPLVGIVWNFFIFSRLSRSYKSYFDSIKNYEVGECGWGFGIASCVCVVLEIVIFPLISLFNFASLILMIVYFIIVFKLRKKLLRSLQ